MKIECQSKTPRVRRFERVYELKFFYLAKDEKPFFTQWLFIYLFIYNYCLPHKLLMAKLHAYGVGNYCTCTYLNENKE